MSGVIGEPVYDSAGMALIGHGDFFDILTLDGVQTSDPSGKVLEAGRCYRLWSNADFLYILAASSPVAASGASIPVTAKMPEYITPKSDMMIAVVDMGSSGNVWIAEMGKYGEPA